MFFTGFTVSFAGFYQWCYSHEQIYLDTHRIPVNPAALFQQENERKRNEFQAT